MERLLLRKAKRGDAEAFCRLMDMQMQSMNKIAHAYLENEEDVADAVQDTILTCYEKLCTLEQDRYFKTWLVRILINKCKDILRKEKRTVCMERLPEAAAEDSGYNLTEWKQMLAELDEKYRTILLLYYLEGFNTKEISVLLEMNESTVKSRLQRGRRTVLHWGLGLVCAFVIFLGMGFYLNMTNPVLAQDLPLIGGIFKRIQEYSGIWSDGNVSKYAVPLQDENGAYAKTSNGVTVTVSEAYVNPLRVYLAFTIASETALTEMECIEEEPERILTMLWDLQYEYSFMDEEYVQTKWQKDNTVLVDGILVDDYTFEGVLIFDFQHEKGAYQAYVNTFYEEKDKKKAEIPDSFTIDLNLTRIGGFKKDEEEWYGGYTEEEYQSLSPEKKEQIRAEVPKEYSSYPNPHQYVWVDGAWNFEIPVTVDESGVVILDEEYKDYEIDGIKTPQHLIVKVKRGVDVVAVDAKGYLLPKAEEGWQTTDKIGEWEYRFLTEGYDTSRIEIYGLGKRFYDEMQRTGKWSELMLPDEEGRYGGADIEAVLEEYQEYHKTIHFK